MKTVAKFFLNHENIHTDNIKKHLTNPTEIKIIIKQLLNNNSPGIDGIDNKLIINLPKKAILHFNYIVNTNKTGENSNPPTNYKPISLLPMPRS